VPFISTFIWFLRDRGHGQVTLDAAGNAMPTYALTDETDQKNFRHATAAAIRIHDAAGAQEIFVSLRNRTINWKRGQSLEQFIETVAKQPLLDGAQPMISAHQLSTCRLGNDPATSVADTDGELRDVKGVWVGDASACPTALGANPMITIMALAERTADKMAPPSRQALDGVSTAANLFTGMVEIMTAPLGAFSRAVSSLSGAASRVGEAGYVSPALEPGRSELIAVPATAMNLVGEVAGLLLRGMAGMVTGPLNALTAGAGPRPGRPFDVGASDQPQDPRLEALVAPLEREES
ncbi:MAG: GMC family oxidoreductase, partial [Candidatus Rokuibacteriota bacterium]